MKQKHTLWVNLAFAAVILVLAGLLLVLRKGPSDAPLAAELIYGDNNTVMQIPLDGPARYDVDTGYLTVHIEAPSIQKLSSARCRHSQSYPRFLRSRS